ncbi:hypothetical protein ACG3SL_18060 [Sphingomonas sp. CJ20]
MDYVDQLFEGETVTLDGNSFRNCTFRNAVLKYAGTGVEMTECRLESFSFQLDGALAGGLFTLYQLFGTEGMLKILRGFVEPSDKPEVIEIG